MLTEKKRKEKRGPDNNQEWSKKPKSQREWGREKEGRKSEKEKTVVYLGKWGEIRD